MTTSISIVTPSYQQLSFLRACVASVELQGYPAVEHLILDGGSTDGTREYLERAGSREVSWWRSHPDGGQGEALNEGFARAAGEWIGWQNSDDFYYPGALWTVDRIASCDPEVSVIVGDTAVVDGRGVSVHLVGVAPVPSRLWLEGYWPYNQSVFFRRDLLARVGPVDTALHLHMDTDLLARVGLLAPRVAYLNCVMGAFRKYAGTKTESPDSGERSDRERALLRVRFGRRMWPEGRLALAAHRLHHHLWAVRAWGTRAVLARLGRRVERGAEVRHVVR